MFTLQDKDGQTVAMKNGEPFEYSTREFASIGARVLSKDLGALRIVGN